MNNLPRTYQVIIVGGGAVGLFLGLCLEQARISYIILEKRSAPRLGSRSLGIHPVSLEMFDELGIAKKIVREGIKIARGHAFANTKKLGTLSFENCPTPYNFILALPQYRTESLLEQSLVEKNPEGLLRNAKVKKVTERNQRAEVIIEYDGKTHTLHSEYVVGCDGKNSSTRKQAGISFEGRQYPDTYIMGDFEDNTGFGSDAAIFLCDNGLIESFPLPKNRRRWVIKTNEYIDTVTKDHITSKVYNRIRHSLDGKENFMISSFGVQKLVANPIVKGSLILCGDAAHIVSPIGGQGMNLGWLDARDLADTLMQVLGNNLQEEIIWNQYQKRRLHAVTNVSRRAEMNMKLGRKKAASRLRNKLISLMLNTPASKIMANIFTMRGVERWVV